MKYTAKQRVFRYLLMCGRHGATLHELMRPLLGGTSADRRLRELRTMGVPVGWKYRTRDGKKTHTTIYYLDGPVDPEVKRKVMNIK